MGLVHPLPPGSKVFYRKNTHKLARYIYSSSPIDWCPNTSSVLRDSVKNTLTSRHLPCQALASAVGSLDPATATLALTKRYRVSRLCGLSGDLGDLGDQSAPHTHTPYTHTCTWVEGNTVLPPSTDPCHVTDYKHIS